jgi:HK97 gp10 family phage protein
MAFRTRLDVDLDWTVIQAMLVDKRGSSARKVANTIERRAKVLAPKKTGALAASIQTSFQRITFNETVFEVGSPLHYAPYQEFGTGPIFAKPGSVLVFEAGGATVFTKRTRGVPAVHYLENALLSIRIEQALR